MNDTCIYRNKTSVFITRMARSNCLLCFVFLFSYTTLIRFSHTDLVIKISACASLTSSSYIIIGRCSSSWSYNASLRKQYQVINVKCWNGSYPFWMLTCMHYSTCTKSVEILHTYMKKTLRLICWLNTTKSKLWELRTRVLTH